ncbi:MAG: transcription termination/antitermination protein NusG [Chloroflexi bacterium]|nr:transcription termination/antitermination protein NusG [Chloroflexota bacterium]
MDPTQDELLEQPENDLTPSPADAAEGDTVVSGDSDEEAGAVQAESGGSWYVVHSYSGYENKVKQNLEQRIETMDMQDRIFSVVVPTEEEVEIREGKKRTSRKRVFPGYILVHMILDDESWYVVRNTPGVTGFVGSGTRPIPLTEPEVSKILERMEAEQPRIKVNFRLGETVRIVEGPFADFMAVVDEIYPDRGKVRVLVSFFGRETPVEMDFLQVEKI